MAQVKSGKPFYFDAEDQEITGRIKLGAIRAVSDGSNYGAVVVLDGNGNPLWQCILSANAPQDETHLPGCTHYNGVVIDTLPTNAVVYVYVE